MVRKDFLKDIHMSIMKEKVEDSNTPSRMRGQGELMRLWRFFMDKEKERGVI